MAVPAAWVVELRVSGLDANGGAYDTGGTDYSQQDAAQLTLADVVSTGGTGLTSVVGGFTSAMIGNGINIVGIGFRRVTTRTNTNTITVDAAVTTGTYTASIGGAVLTPGIAAQIANLTSGISVYQKSGTYTVTSASTNIAAGCVSLSSNGFWWGYNSTRGDNGTRPTIIADGSITTFTLFNVATDFTRRTENVIFDGNARTSSAGYSAAARSSGLRLHAQNCTGIGLSVTSGSNSVGAFLALSSATVCSGTAAISLLTNANGTLLEAYANTTVGIAVAGSSVSFSLSYLNTGGNSDGFQFTGLSGALASCSAYSNGRHNFNSTSSTTSATRLWMNCTSEAAGTSGTGYGFTSTGAVSVNHTLINCADYNSATGARNLTQLTLAMVNFQTLSASPFVDPANGNLAFNATAGGGAAVRGISTTWPRGTSVGYPDGGAIQHADPTRVFSGLYSGGWM